MSMGLLFDHFSDFTIDVDVDVDELLMLMLMLMVLDDQFHGVSRLQPC